MKMKVRLDYQTISTVIGKYISVNNGVLISTQEENEYTLLIIDEHSTMVYTHDVKIKNIGFVDHIIVFSDELGQVWFINEYDTTNSTVEGLLVKIGNVVALASPGNETVCDVSNESDIRQYYKLIRTDSDTIVPEAIPRSKRNKSWSMARFLDSYFTKNDFILNLGGN